MNPVKKRITQGRTNFKTGKLSEKIAGFFLLMRGYKIISYRYKTLVGEIDILACKRDTLIAVEVKHRRKTDDALSSILPRQKERVRRALSQAHKHYPKFTHLRIDTILISPLKWPIHIKNAF
jgi:putative endonuclease